MVLDLLQIPFDAKEDVRMNELMRLAHQFLQNFCLGNQNNQVSPAVRQFYWELSLLTAQTESLSSPPVSAVRNLPGCTDWSSSVRSSQLAPSLGQTFIPTLAHASVLV